MSSSGLTSTGNVTVIDLHGKKVCLSQDLMTADNLVHSCWYLALSDGNCSVAIGNPRSIIRDSPSGRMRLSPFLTDLWPSRGPTSFFGVDTSAFPMTIAVDWGDAEYDPATGRIALTAQLALMAGGNSQRIVCLELRTRQAFARYCPPRLEVVIRTRSQHRLWVSA